ncbi:MAG: RagB/SusD family nutrient uptake outer membrane protein, partial [Bacteroides sp.]
MKNRNILHKMVLGGVCLASMMGLISCDPLGMEPTTMVDQDRFWLNPQLTREYVNNFYIWTPLASGQNFQSEQWSDNCQGNSEKDWNTYNQYSFNYRRYDPETSITSSTAITEAVKNQLLAECYFFRAWEFFDMEKFWGTVPYLDRSLSITDETFLPRIKREQLFDNMLADLTQAATHFAAFGGKPLRGMVDANVVEAFRSRVALAAACAAEASAKGLYSFDDKGKLFTFDKAASHYYQIAYDASRSLIGKYSLEANYADLFTSANSHKSVESIWPVMFNKANRSGFNPTSINGPDGAYYGNSEAVSLEW